MLLGRIKNNVIKQALNEDDNGKKSSIQAPNQHSSWNPSFLS